MRYLRSIAASIILTVGIGIQAKEFLYPVAFNAQEGGTEIYLLYQKSVDHLELLVWDPVTKVTSKGLLSTFTPGVFKILPDRSGFSFVDKGRVLVKSFTKRSPKSVAFYAPLDDIALIEWIDSSTFYFMAKESQHYALFQGNTQGDLHLLAQTENADLMYPQKVGPDLFFVKREQEKERYHYSLVRSHYPATPTFSLQSESIYEQMALLQEEQQTKQIPLVEQEHIDSLIDLGDGAASFLHMTSEDEGFYIEHPHRIERDEAWVTFGYYHIQKTGNGWERNKLFSFRLPAHFIVGDSESRLYESLLPFLPRHTKEGIFFTDCFDVNRLRTGIFKFIRGTNTVQSVSLEQHDDLIGDAFFSPLCIGSMVFYGGVLLPEDFGTGNRLPAIWINEDGRICADLPIAVAVDDSPLSPHA